jgi:hypothetical protein
MKRSGVESYWELNSCGIELAQGGANTNTTVVCVKQERVVEVWAHQPLGVTDGLFDEIHADLRVLAPLKDATVLDQLVQRASDLAEVFDEVLVVTGQPKETANLQYVDRLDPICDGTHFLWRRKQLVVHGHMAKVLSLASSKETLAGTQFQVDGHELGQHPVQDNEMLIKLFGEEQRVVQILSCAWLGPMDLLLQNSVHDHLICTWCACEPKRHAEELAQPSMG